MLAPAVSVDPRPRMILWAATLASLAVLALAGSASGQQNLKIGYVDSNKIIEATPGVAEAKATYEKQAEEWKTALETHRTELATLYEDYNKQAAILSPEKKTEKQQEILAKERTMQEYFQQKFGPQGEAGTREKELLRPIYDRINQAIEEVRAAESYSLIFDLQAGALAAGDPALDLTPKVIERLKTQSTASN
ncbi:MAG: OmpH family outer membrane protein [Gemmatimonadota bacterium]